MRLTFSRSQIVGVALLAATLGGVLGAALGSHVRFSPTVVCFMLGVVIAYLLRPH